MHISKYIRQSLTASFTILACGLFGVAAAQTSSQQQTVTAPQKQVGPTVLAPEEKAPAAVAGESDLFCAGFIRSAPLDNPMQIVGSEQEQERHTFAQGDIVFINGGVQQNVRVGQEFAVIRPRGNFKSKFSKKGRLGVYMQELGRLRVIRVKDQNSVAIIDFSCDNMLLGDLLMNVPARTSPTVRVDAAMDHFAEPSGKQRGRIVMARDLRETVTRNHIVYIDLGAEDNVRSGDRLTIFRKAGGGNVTNFWDEEITSGSSYGFESEQYKGGKFSNKAQRAQLKPEPGVYTGNPVTTPKIKDRRVAVPRKFLGEMVILNVQDRTATAIITDVAQEIHTGDFVEVQ